MRKKKNTDGKKESFREKLKDKKYKAKVGLIGYGALIVILILYLNLANMGRDVRNVDTSVDELQDVSSLDEDTDKARNLFQKLDNNYQYDVNVMLKKRNGEEEEVHSLHYYGKRYESNVLLNKEDNQENLVYYKNDDQYYHQVENGLELVKEEVIYKFFGGEYIELAGIKNLIGKAGLDHVTDYSSGKKEYVYHLNIRDVILSYQGEEQVEFSVVIEGEAVTIQVDYSDLLHSIDETIMECEMTAVYTEIGKVEEFSIVEEDGSLSE